MGRKKLAAVGGVVALVAVALLAWLLWGTDGLLAATLAALLSTTLALGWLVARSQRRIEVLVRQSQAKPVTGSVTTETSGEHAEQLLRAVHAGFTRSEHVLDTLVEEWEKTRTELQSAVQRIAEHEFELTRGRTPKDDSPET